MLRASSTQSCSAPVPRAGPPKRTQVMCASAFAPKGALEGTCATCPDESGCLALQRCARPKARGELYWHATTPAYAINVHELHRCVALPRPSSPRLPLISHAVDPTMCGDRGDTTTLLTMTRANNRTSALIVNGLLCRTHAMVLASFLVLWRPCRFDSS